MNSERLGSNATTPIGLIGLGSLGLPIAINLLDSGLRVLGYQRRPSAALSHAGGEVAATIAEIGRRCTVILTCLPSATALAEVVSGPAGLRDHIAPNTILVELSTLPVAAKATQQKALSDVGATMLDCSVSGNATYVAHRSAALFASGVRADFERCASTLSAITDHVTYVGSFGAGTMLKLIASMLVPIHTLAAAEAFTMASRAGIDPAIVLDAITGTQASSAMFETRGAKMVSGDHEGASLAAYYSRNIAKSLEAARDLGGFFPLLDTIDACYRAAIEAGFGHLDQSALFEFLKTRNG